MPSSEPELSLSPLCGLLSSPFLSLFLSSMLRLRVSLLLVGNPWEEAEILEVADQWRRDLESLSEILQSTRMVQSSGRWDGRRRCHIQGSVHLNS